MGGGYIKNGLCGPNPLIQSGISPCLAGLSSTQCFVNNKSMQVVSLSA